MAVVLVIVRVVVEYGNGGGGGGTTVVVVVMVVIRVEVSVWVDCGSGVGKEPLVFSAHFYARLNVIKEFSLFCVVLMFMLMVALTGTTVVKRR